MQPLNLMLILATLTLGLALTPRAQDSGQPESSGKGARDARASQLASMQGAWRLKKLESPTLQSDLRQEVAYCLIVEDFLSIELHLGWTDPNGANVERKDFQSGTHRFELDARGRMVTSTLIGAFVSREEKLEFEQPGKARTYQVSVTGPAMTWKREDGTRFEFERLSEGKPHGGTPRRAADGAQDAGNATPPK